MYEPMVESGVREWNQTCEKITKPDQIYEKNIRSDQIEKNQTNKQKKEKKKGKKTR
jgi:hypothetical protein